MTAQRPIIVGVGEVLWDLLPGGRQLGGAPANFAYHAHALGADAYVVTAVGDDPLGHEIIDRLETLGLSTQCVSIDADAPTGTVTVSLTPDGQPAFTIHEDVAWDRIPLSSGAAELVGRADAVCFGTLAQRSDISRSTIRGLLAATRSQALKIFDINLRQQFFSRDVIESSLRAATVLKINDDELPIVAKMLGLYGETNDQISALAQEYDLLAVALTRGSHGSQIFHRGERSEHPGLPADVVDTVGAGDSFTAAMTLGLLADWPLPVTTRWANELAAYVCTQPGATPPLSERFRQAFA